jgi:hypothetical protein
VPIPVLVLVFNVRAGIECVVVVVDVVKAVVMVVVVVLLALLHAPVINEIDVTNMQANK